MSESQKLNKLHELALIFIAAKATHLAVELKLNHILTDTAISLNDLAKQLNYDVTGLHKLLRLLDSYELVNYQENFVSATPNTSLLKYIDSPHIFLNYKNVDNLGEAFKTNQGVFAKTFDSSFYDYLKKHELINPFEVWCTESAKQWLPTITDMYDFSAYNTIADIGGGQGFLLSLILKQNKHARGFLVDQKEVIAGADSHLKQLGISERITSAAGDFFDASTLPKDQELYITCRTLLNWDNEECCRILNTMYEAMPQGAKLIVIDFYIPEKSHPHYQRALLSDTALLALVNSANRTLPEWEKLVSSSKLSITNIYTSEGNNEHEPFMPLFIIETIKE